ncbi:MAG: hypothetical protein GSR80_000031 [Desulfurococcales archaeon]|nr:hypothetical protein [Desulfurococcales archaeon]
MIKAFIDSPAPRSPQRDVGPKARMLYKGFYIRALAEYKLCTDVLVLGEVVYVSREK